MESSGLLKQYFIQRGTYVDKKMEPLANREALDNFSEMWMFPGLKVTVLEDEDGEMREYRCKNIDGENVWVPIENVEKKDLSNAVESLQKADKNIEEGYKQADAAIEKNYKEADAAFNERVSAFESLFVVLGDDVEK